MPITKFPYGVMGFPMVGTGLEAMFQATPFANVNYANQNVFFVDGDHGGDSNDGLSPETSFATIQAAVNAAQAGAAIYIKVRDVAAGATDPASYAETIIIPATKPDLKLIGVGEGRVQGGLPQIKKGSGSTALITVRAPGCLFANLGFNMSGSTGAGILLDDDGATKTAFGTTIFSCHFKNNANKAAAAGGGAVAWAATGGAWQVRISDCEFYNCVTGINLLGTGSSRPQDVVIEDCAFLSTDATAIDGDIDLSAGTGVNGLLIKHCSFATVDVPSLAAGNCDLYVDLTNCTNGAIVECSFACTGKTFGNGNAAKWPVTIRAARCYQENAIITRT